MEKALLTAASFPDEIDKQDSVRASFYRSDHLDDADSGMTHKSAPNPSYASNSEAKSEKTTPQIA